MKEIDAFYTNIGGELKEIDAFYTNIGGELKEIYTSLPTNLNLHWGGFTGESCTVTKQTGYNFNYEYSTFPIGKFKTKGINYVNFTCNQDDDVTAKYRRTNNVKKFVETHNLGPGATNVYFHSYYVVQLKTENSVIATPYASWVIERTINYFHTPDNEIVFQRTDFGVTGTIITSESKSLDENEYYVFATRFCLINSRYGCASIDFEGMELDVDFNFQRLT